MVDQGDPSESAVYYAYLEQQLGIPAAASLDEVIAYAGYSGVTGRQLETTEPDDLMAQFPGEVLALRFFAPKIIDVSQADGDRGWRKVVRLLVRDRSPAAARNIQAMFLLFNVFQPKNDVGTDPFGPCLTDGRRCSQNNQVMLTPSSPAPGADTAYWLVFERADVGGGKRTDNLQASFDGGDQSTGSSVRPYYVPHACAQCHGGSQSTAKLNLLDSDHWFDRVQSDDDFVDVADKSVGVLFDGGVDTKAPRFNEVFRVLRSLNQEIRDQIAGAGGEDFNLRAADTWLRVHSSSVAFAPLAARALLPPATNPTARVWSDTPADRDLLGRLNRYCYRCHSSIAYHVFDKQAVFARRNGMIRRIERGASQPGGMPQDRILDKDTVSDLVARLRALQ